MSEVVRKNVYINNKTGKWYTFDDPKEAGGKPILVTVFCTNTIWNAATTRVDSKDKIFKVLNVKEIITANGYRVYKAV